VNTATLYESMSDYVLSLIYSELGFAENHEFDPIRSAELSAEMDDIRRTLEQRGRTFSVSVVEDGTVYVRLDYPDGETPW
jgi:hypothetical protein